jgi:hypothetical protein
VDNDVSSQIADLAEENDEYSKRIKDFHDRSLKYLKGPEMIENAKIEEAFSQVESFLKEIDEKNLDLRKKEFNGEAMNFHKNITIPKREILGRLVKVPVGYGNLKVIKVRVNSDLGFKFFKEIPTPTFFGELRPCDKIAPVAPIVYLFKNKNDTNVAFCFERNIRGSICSIVTYDNQTRGLFREDNIIPGINCGIYITKLADKYIFTVNFKEGYYPYYR